MAHIALVCTGCQHREEHLPPLSTCTTCGAPLAVHYARPPTPLLPQPHYPGIWRYKDRLPLHDASNIVSLGEGSTPCIPLERVGQRLGLAHLYAKVEYMNPTGSFKDRGAAVLVSVAQEAGLRELVEDSSGNAGASLAAYCARANMRAVVFVPASAPQGKTEQIRLHGADLRPVQGDRQAVAVAAQAYVRERGSFYGSHNLSPYFAEGMKSFAYELVNDLPGQFVLHIVFPVGNGSLLLGSYFGFLELQATGTVQQVPRLHCMQAEACMPIASLLTGQSWAPSGLVHTVASGIAVSHPPRGRQVAQAVRATGGTAVAVAEQDIVRWHRLLAREEGLFIEPTSAAAFAGLEALARQGVVKKEDITVVPLTGSGLKDAIPQL